MRVSFFWNSEFNSIGCSCNTAPDSWGCGENNGKSVVDKVRYEPEIRFEGLPSLVYAKGSNKSYTGKMIGYLDEKKIIERNFKDGMVSGLTTEWHENGQMARKTNYDRDLVHGPSKE